MKEKNEKGMKELREKKEDEKENEKGREEQSFFFFLHISQSFIQESTLISKSYQE